ncbi:hypothetical protein BKA61DRAFT_532953 [Leptodontidium sp. MPI-SDFR-AT-0119]|nr:hypothetical protein BKA61DRAFT_532953 [Leptodontidium sp. MPI-SDFR-AT-0119]
MASVGYEYSLDHQLRRKIQVQHVENEVTKEQTILPKFEDLPLGKDDPPYSAWGLWGDNDEVGTVRLLTPARVARGAQEIREGLRYSLNWSLNSPTTPGFGRSHYPFCHTLHCDTPGLLVFDDSITFNTQKSTQWDGLRHFAYQKEQKFYQGVSKAEILAPGSTKLGLQNVDKQGGIAGRAVLLDYAAYAESVGYIYDALSHSISFEELMACVRYQEEISGESMTFLTGDVLIVRCGYTKQYLTLGKEQEEEAGKHLPPLSCGVGQDVRLLKWLWDHHFSAVAGDSPSFESFPPNEDAGFLFHEVLLAGWGCPIGEMLWLEDLSKSCMEKKRYSFFVASSPLNIEGGVASPANMMAIL